MKPQVLVLMLALAAGTASADTLQTKSGETIKGRVLEETQAHVRIRTRYGELTVPRGDVRRHTRATYAVKLKDGRTLEGHIVGETEKELRLEVGGKERKVASGDVKAVSEKKPERKPKRLNPQQVRAVHQRAMAHFRKKEYTKAVAEYAKAIQSNPDDMIALYNTACAYSLLKDKAKAVEFLRQSVEAGYVNFAHMEQDGDLDNIRDAAGYKELLEHKDEHVRKSTGKAVERITKSLARRGVDAKRYKPVFDRERNFVYLHTKTEKELAIVRKDLEDYAEHQWAHLFQNKPKQPLHIVLLTAGDSRKVFRGRAGGMYSAGSNTLLCGDMPAYKLMKTSVVVHEFTHALHFADMLARKQRHPIWLIEGLATLFEASRRNGGVVPHHSFRLAHVQVAVRARRHLPWKTLMKMNQLQFMRVARLSYAQSRYMLYYMYEKGLLKKFYDEYTNKESYASDKSALEAFEVVFGKPIESVERDWRQWVLKQRVPPLPYLGIQSREQRGQVVVLQVVGGSPAGKAGLKTGDVIAGIGGGAIRSQSDLMAAVGSRKAGDEVEIEVLRKGKTVLLKATLGKRGGGTRPRPPTGAPYLGLAVESRDGAVYVKEVSAGSPAQRAGLRPGMGLLEFNGQKLGSVRDFLSAVKKTRPGQTVKVKTKQGEEVEVVAVKLAAQPGG